MRFPAQVLQVVRDVIGLMLCRSFTAELLEVPCLLVLPSWGCFLVTYVEIFCHIYKHDLWEFITPHSWAKCFLRLLSKQKEFLETQKRTHHCTWPPEAAGDGPRTRPSEQQPALFSSALGKSQLNSLGCGNLAQDLAQDVETFLNLI